MSNASAYSSYLGVTTITRWPRLCMPFGNDPMTSPKPPVLDHGAHSAPTKTMFITLSPASGLGFGAIGADTDGDNGAVGCGLCVGAGGDCTNVAVLA